MTDTTRNRTNIMCYYVPPESLYLLCVLVFVLLSSDLLSPIVSPPIPKCCFCSRNKMRLHLRVGTIKNYSLPSTQNMLFIHILITPVLSSNIATVYLYSHYLNGLNGNQMVHYFKKMNKQPVEPKDVGSSCLKSLAREN